MLEKNAKQNANHKRQNNFEIS